MRGIKVVNPVIDGQLWLSKLIQLQSNPGLVKANGVY